MSENLKLFLGGGVIVVIAIVASIWVKDFIPAAIAWGGTIIGAAAMKMKGDQ